MVGLVACDNPARPPSAPPTPAPSVSVRPALPAPATPAVRAPAAPVQVESRPGVLRADVRWPFAGMAALPVPRRFERGVRPGWYQELFAATGLTLAGVHWTWGPGPADPRHVVVVPTTVGHQPVLVWGVVPATAPAGPSGLAAAERRWTGPVTLWMTPWRRTGGALATGARRLVTIPAVWSPGGARVTFPGTPGAPSANPVATAWTGWVPAGWRTRPPRVPLPAAAPGTAPTVATRLALYAAVNGVVLQVATQLVGAPQGAAQNFYYLDLAHHQVDGLASLATGGGITTQWLVVSGLVLTQQADPLGGVGYLFNEADDRTTRIPPSPAWAIVGTAVENAATGVVLARPDIAAALLQGPTASAFRR